MSLFSKSSEFTAEEAVVAILFLAVTADGNIAPAEEELVIAASNRMKLLRKLTVADFNAVVHRVRDRIDAQGRDEVFAAGAVKVPGDLKPTVYALAADIIFCDGSAEPSESEYLRKVQEAMSVTDELATRIIEVLRIKNCG